MSKAFDARPCHGFRVAAENCSHQELAVMAHSENAMLRHARIVNGRHPDYQNGFARGFSRAACQKPVRIPKPSVFEQQRQADAALLRSVRIRMECGDIFQAV